MDNISQDLALLKARVAELEQILDSINDGFFSLDQEFNFKFVNRAFEKMCGRSGIDVIGRSYWDVFPKAKDQKFWTMYRTAYNEQVTIRFEEYANSMERWVIVNVYPSPTGLSVYFQDVTEQRKSRLLIEEQNKRLREIAQIQSHRVRKPVASILGLAHVLEDEDPEGNKEIIKGIVASCKELDEIIKEITEKTKIEVGDI